MIFVTDIVSVLCYFYVAIARETHDECYGTDLGNLSLLVISKSTEQMKNGGAVMSIQQLKNIEHKQVLELSSLVSYQEGQIVSRTLAQNAKVSLTLFAFDQGEEISSHTSDGDAMVTLLEGAACITVGGKEYHLTQGQTIVMPADVPHALFAVERFKMQLLVVFPQNAP